MRRLLLIVVSALGLVALVPGIAAGHVNVDGDGATQGGFGVVTFRVPNERDDASTTKLEVKLPTDTPIAFVSVKPVPGWTAKVKTTELDEPIEVHGEQVTEAPSEVVWSGGEIKPGEFQEFEISAGPMPEVDSVTFPAIQTYSSGEEVSWIEETPANGEEPEHPAPVLELAKATTDEHGGGDAAVTATTEVAGSNETATPISADAPSQDDVDSANTKALVGSILGLLGLVLGTTAIVLTVRNKRSAS